MSSVFLDHLLDGGDHLFATCDEYMRTMLGVLPGLYMMGAMLLQTVADACRKRCAARKEKNR